ncbi:MAG: DNA polymerase III subunit delta' [Nocardioides sp.]|jgi:DNA polymerase-3 subunit delta'
MTVWDTLVGQQVAITALQAATSGQGMTHAWLFSGPPGSGRSNLALVFAAALQCERPGGVAAGCGECHACHTVMVKTHADVRLVATQQLTIGVDDVRELVRRAALTPVGSGWQIIIIEDADRLTDQASNALLKAIEEPSERTVWMLCAPTAEDMLPTIRSRCRMVELSTPHARDVEAFLIAQGADRQRAHTAARAAQGHIGRARALATDDETMQRRHSVVTLPFGLTSLGAAMSAAETVNEAAKAEAKAFTDEADEREKTALASAYGVVQGGRRPREYAPALAALERDQKKRATRQVRDVVDRGLMDLASVYRDALRIAAASGAELVNEDLRRQVQDLAGAASAEVNLARIEMIFAAREQLLEFNVPPLLALESMMVGLWLAGMEAK